MTISYKKLGKGCDGGEYYINSAQVDDYYLNQGVEVHREPPGRWYDPAGTMPAITDGETVNAETFRAQLGGYDPRTGVALVKGAGAEHVSGYDFTFSAPKAISAIWSQLDPEQRDAIEAAQQAAVRRALQFMSDKAGISRRGAGGVIKENVNLIAALWPHASSRENDPQLHTHSTVFNLARCEDGTYRTIDVNQILKWQTAIAGVYHTELAAKLTDSLGIRCEVKEDEFIFDVPDVPEAIKEHWSKRSQAIKAATKDLATDALSKAVLDKITLETRDKKSELPRDELLARWVEEGQELGFTRKQAEAYFNQGELKPLAPEEIQDIAAKAAQRLTFSQSVFAESAAYAMVGVMMQGRGTAADIEAAGDWLVNQHLVFLGNDLKGHRVYSTQEMIDLERQMIEDAQHECWAALDATASHAAGAIASHVQPDDVVDAAIRAKKGMSQEQALAVRHACFDTRMVSIVEGSAGAGKSFTMESVKAVYEKQGYTLQGLALSWSAAGVLSEEAKIAHTRAIEGFVRELATGKIKLDAKSVVLIDEGGLVGSRHMAAILAASKKAGTKVILTGDSLQLAPVEAGGAMEAIIEVIGSARIDEVRRQGSHVRNDPVKYAEFQWQRDAVLQFAHGRAAEALQAYQDHGLVKLTENHATAIDAMIADWNEYRLSEGAGTALLLANDNETVRELNARVRELLRAEGKLGEDVITLRTTDLKNTATIPFAIGDKVMFRKNDKKLGIQGDQTKDEQRRTAGVFNRTQGTILSIRMDGDVPIIKVKLDKGGTVEIRAGKGGYWDAAKKAVPLQHAMGTTIYASQGMTVSQSFLLDSRHIERRLAYVGMSRAREKCRVYIDKEAVHERMMERLGTDEWRPLSEVADDELMTKIKASWSRASEKLTTVQYINARKQAAADLAASNERSSKQNGYEHQQQHHNQQRTRTPPPAARAGLRDMSELDVVPEQSGATVLLPDHVSRLVAERDERCRQRGQDVARPGVRRRIDGNLRIIKERMEKTMQTLHMTPSARRAQAEQNYREFGERIETAKRIDLPAWLIARGVELKKEGTNGWCENKAAKDNPFHFFQGDDGLWRARSGDTYLNAIQYVQQLENREFKDTVAVMTGGDGMTALAIDRALQQSQALGNKSRATAAIVIRAADKEQQERAAVYARDERGISRETLIEAHKQGFLALDDRGVAFIGRDHEGKICNAETRLLKPEKYKDEWLSKVSYAGSDKTYSPILRGNDRDVHMVEGGFDALALHDLAKREGKEPPTIIVTGGARTLKWSQNPQVQGLIKGAETVTNHRENEIDKKTGLPDPKKQADTDAAHEKQVAAIIEIRGNADGVKKARPPAGIKDLDEWNKKQQEHQRQLQLSQEEDRRSGLRM